MTPSSPVKDEVQLREAVNELWPELAWIENETLRERVLETWVMAFERAR